MSRRRASELAAVPALLAALPSHVIIQYPTGRYGFVGRVDLRLRYRLTNGAELTPDVAQKIASFGPGLFLKSEIVSLSWASPEDAAKAAAAYGYDAIHPKAV